MKLSEISVKRPITTMMVFLGVLLFGAVSLKFLPLDVMPDMEYPALTVVTVYPGASADEVESQVSEILEAVLAGTEDVKTVRSTSKENVSFVNLAFEWGTDVTDAANNARDLLEAAKSRLPDAAHQPLIYKINSSMMPVLGYGITADESLNGLETIISDEIASVLRKVDGVGTVVWIGAPERQIQVDVYPERLQAYGLSVGQLSTVLQMENLTVPVGSVNAGTQDFTVKMPGKFQNVDEIRDLAIGSFQGQVVHLRDVAGVTDTFRERDDYSCSQTGRGAALLIQKQSGANTLDVINGVRAKVEELKEDLPRDIVFNEMLTTDELIVEALKSLANSMKYALLFVVLVVFAFLREWRGALIVFLTIPTSLIVAFIVMYGMGWTINVMSLMALVIALGMVVDNAIVVYENITQHIENGERPKEAAIFGTSEMGMAITASTATTLMVFVPMIFMEGIIGVMFEQLAVLTSVTMLASLFTALTLTPMVASKLMKGKKKGEVIKHGKLYLASERVLVAMENSYKRLLQWAVSHKTIVIVANVALLIATYFVGKTVSTDYIPEFDAGDVSVVIETEMGTSAEQTFEVAQKVGDLMKEMIPEMNPESFGILAGQTEDGILSSSGFKEGKNIATISCHLSLPNERDRSAKEIVNSLIPHLDAIPEIKTYALTGGSILSQAMMGNMKPVEVMIYGRDFEKMNAVARKFEAEMLQMQGLRNVETTIDEGKAEYHIHVDKTKASQLGFNTAAVGIQLRQSIYGADAGDFTEDGEKYEINVRYAKDRRQNIEDIRNIMVTSLTGVQVPLSAIADVKLGFGPDQINRKTQERFVAVKADLDGIALGDAVTLVNELKEGVETPRGVSVEIEGQVGDQGDTFADLILILVLGVVLIYMIMAAQFESLLDPMIVMLAVPFTLIGVIWAFKLTGTTLSVPTFIGLIMLMGIVVNNGIVLVDYINLLRARGAKLYDAVAEAGRSRMRPVIMTTLTTVLSMVPMATADEMGKEMSTVLGITIIGGLLVSTFITLIFVPTIYAVFHAKDEK